MLQAHHGYEKELYDELLAVFRTEWVELGPRLFNLEWHSSSGHSTLNPPYDPKEREPVGIVHLPMDTMGEKFTLGDVITLPRADRLTEAREGFKRLSARAGACLPAEFREVLAEYCPCDVSDSASWWYALLFWLEGSVTVGSDGRFLDHIILDRPFLRSVYAIEGCGLNTDSPVVPERNQVELAAFMLDQETAPTAAGSGDAASAEKVVPHAAQPPGEEQHEAGNVEPSEPGGELGPNSPTGFLGGAALATALGVHTTRRDALFRKLERQRKSLGDDCWHEVREPRPNSPRFLYRSDSSELRDLAAAYTKPKLA